MKIAISAESTVDLTKEYLEKYDIKTLPFRILLGEKERFDGEITADEIIAYVNESGKLPKTGAVNFIQYKEHFDNLLKEYDAVIHFSMSSELSSAYSNAEAVSKEYNNVFVIDTRSLSTGIALLCIYARTLADSGKDVKDIYNICLEKIPKVRVSLVLSRLDYLYKGGRCSVLTCLGANLLKIRPEIIVKDGKLIVGKKYRGNYDTILINYCRDILENSNPDFENVFITYTTASEETLKSIEEYLKDFGFKNIMLTRANGTITSHCGEHCLGAFFLEN